MFLLLKRLCNIACVSKNEYFLSFFFFSFFWIELRASKFCRCFEEFELQKMLGSKEKCEIRFCQRNCLYRQKYCYHSRSNKDIRKNIFACLFSVHNTISLSRHEQVCLMRLRFERYFSHHRAM